MIPRFRLGGIAVRFDLGWLLIVGLVTWTLASGYFPHALPHLGAVGAWLHGLVGAFVLFTSVLLHELAHALTARARGVGVGAIRLHVLGGVAELEDEPPSPGVEVAVALAGPAVNVALAGLALAGLALAPPRTSTATVLGYAALVNLLLAVFNLLPAFPLDGGRLLRAALWRRTADLERATVGAARVGGGVALAVAALGGAWIFTGDAVGGLWIALIGVYVHQAARAGGELGRLRARLERVRVHEIMTALADGEAAEVGEGSVRSQDSAWLAFLRLARSRRGRVAVIDDGALIGVLDRRRLHDLLGEPARDRSRAA